MMTLRSSSIIIRSFALLAVCFILSGMAAVPAESRRVSKDSAPDFSLPAMDGKTVKLSDFYGKNPVMLVFFATWCAPCNMEVPALNKIHEEYGSRGLVLMAVDVQETQDWVARWVKKRNAKYSIVLDQKGQVAQSYGIRSVPTNILIDFDGKVTFWHNALPKEHDLEALFKKSQSA